MNAFQIAALLLSIAAGMSYINYRYVKLPSAIGLMTISVTLSLGLILLGRLGLHVHEMAEGLLQNAHFSETLMEGMLSFMLFAGALKLNLDDLRRERATVMLLATVGVLISTGVVGLGAHVILGWLGHPLPLLHCFIFGALISPTDPIAVLSILSKAGIDKGLLVQITGESLFNDGVGIVVFLALLALHTQGGEVSAQAVLFLFAEEAIGGAIFGLGLGWLAYKMLKDVDDYNVEILITLAMVAGGYALASRLHVSGPIAIVVAGLLIGNQGRSFAMSATTREHLDLFWELVDEILNAVLFVWIGLELLVLTMQAGYLAIALAMIPLVLLARFTSVWPLLSALKAGGKHFAPGTLGLLSWGGLRGGISIALALSLDGAIERELLLVMTYAVVVFSILVQGLSLPSLARKLAR